MNLNKRQQKVADTRNPRVMVQAGAGTGKTASSVAWVAGLLKEGVLPRQIVMLTFTRKAAEEMGRRVVREAGEYLKDGRVIAGTYHSVASLLLRKDSKGFNVKPGFTTMDDGDATHLWKKAAKFCNYDEKVRDISSLVSKSINWCADPKVQLEKAGLGNAIDVWHKYEDLKKENNVLDYDDLMLKWLKRLINEPEFATKIKNAWTHVLVDEMQDNNRLNYEILKRWNPNNLLVVGDLNQSIYGFRAAMPELMLQFQKDNPNAEILELTDNYRSKDKILDIANEVVSQSIAPLVLEGTTHQQGKTNFQEFGDAFREAQSAANHAINLIRSGVLAGDIAYLARSASALRPLEMILRQNKVPYKKYGGVSVADAAEVKDFVSFIRFAHNPEDKLAATRGMCMFQGIGESTAEKSFGLMMTYPKAAMEMEGWIGQLKELPFHKGLHYNLDRITPLIKANYPQDHESRLDTLKTLVEEAGKGYRSTSEFLDAFSIDSLEQGHPDTTLVLSTIHSSKGLEWKHVWIVGAGSEQMPHPRSKSERERAEERRLFYVAATRAKDELVISYPLRIFGKDQIPSPFVPDFVISDSRGANSNYRSPNYQYEQNSL